MEWALWLGCGLERAWGNAWAWVLGLGWGMGWPSLESAPWLGCGLERLWGNVWAPELGLGSGLPRARSRSSLELASKLETERLAPACEWL